MQVIETLSPFPFWKRFTLIFLGFLFLGTYASFYALPMIDIPFTQSFVLVRLLMFVVYMAVVWLSRDLRSGPLLGFLLLLGLLHHVCMLPMAPSMSDDLYRYIWDGKVQYHGINSFLYPPTSRQLSFLMGSWFHPFINHADYRTLYPPTAQWLFWLAQTISPGQAWGYKVLLLLFQVATAGMLAIWLRWRKLPMGRLLWFAWCPLLVFEVMLDGHLDGFAPPLLLMVLLAAHVRRPWLCGIALGAVLLVKPLPLFLVPLLLWHLRWRKAIKMGLACALTCVVLYLPFFDAGAFLFKAIIAYSKHWHFNGPMFELLGHWFVPSACRSIIAGCILLSALVAPFVRIPLERRFLIPLLTYMLMTPTLYPWYMVWLVPWLVMAPSAWLFWLVGAICSAHLVQHTYAETGVWKLSTEVMLFEFVPFLILLLGQAGLQLHLRWNNRAKGRKKEAKKTIEVSRVKERELKEQMQEMSLTLKRLEAEIQLLRKE